LERLIEHQIVAATNNAHKLSEIRPLIEPDFRILSLDDIGCRQELPETHETLEENSLEKAAYVLEGFQLPCFADDTGLEVEALNGAPGVYSARYAGEQRNSEDNMTLLLKNLSGRSDRKARFRTVITLLGIEGIQRFEGVINGTILPARRGTAGFGYDPVFQPDGFDKSMAEMSMAEKNAISHRGQAIRKLVNFLRQTLLQKRSSDH
jgi:XTP/dITP diphosphohydrolase